MVSNGEHKEENNNYGRCAFLEHVDEVKRTAEFVTKIHDDIKTLNKHAEHLKSLQEISLTLRVLNQSLVGPATGRRQVPLATHLFTVAILGLALMMTVAFALQVDFDITRDNFTFQRKHKAQQNGVEQKPYQP